jgi:hypothetical protein
MPNFSADCMRVIRLANPTHPQPVIWPDALMLSATVLVAKGSSIVVEACSNPVGVYTGRALKGASTRVRI